MGAGQQQPVPSMAPDKELGRPVALPRPCRLALRATLHHQPGPPPRRLTWPCQRPTPQPAAACLLPCLPGRVTHAHAAHAAMPCPLWRGEGMPLSCPPVPCCPALWPCSALAWLPCPAPCCCCPACPQHPSATTSPLPLPLARLSSVLSAPDPNTDTGEVPLTPLILICSVSTRHQKFRLCLFVPRKTPAWNIRPGVTRC